VTAHRELVTWILRPFVWLACKLAGIDAAEKRYELESRRLARDHELKACDELEECVRRVEALGPIVPQGMTIPNYTQNAAEYAAMKHRLRDLHADLPGLCDASIRAVSAPPEWQTIAQLARPAIAARRAKALARF